MHVKEILSTLQKQQQDLFYLILKIINKLVMKRTFLFTLIFIVFAFNSCKKEKIEEKPNLKTRLKKERGWDYINEYFYNDSGRLSKVLIYNSTTGKDSNYNFQYIDNKLISYESSEVGKFIFLYNGDTLIKITKNYDLDNSRQYHYSNDYMKFFYVNNDLLVDSIIDNDMQLQFALKYKFNNAIQSTLPKKDKLFENYDFLIYNFVLGEVVHDDKKNPYSDLPYAYKLCNRLDFNENNILSQQYWMSTSYFSIKFTLRYNEDGYRIAQKYLTTYKINNSGSSSEGGTSGSDSKSFEYIKIK
jgi:hypothetical protein